MSIREEMARQELEKKKRLEKFIYYINKQIDELGWNND